MTRFPIRAPRGAALLAALALCLAAVSVAPAEEGGAPVPPPDSVEVEVLSPDEPRSLQPAAPAAPEAPTALAPGLRAAPVFTWGDSTGLVLPPLADVRGQNELATEIEASRALRAGAENRMLKARERTVRWKAQVEIQKAREETLKRKIDLAKKEKREGDKRDLEAEKKREEKVRAYYDSMRQAMEAAAEFHKASFEYAQARVSAAELEQRLGERWGAGGYEARIAGDARNMEKRLLESVKERSEKLSDLASREKSLADKRLDVLKQWGELQR